MPDHPTHDTWEQLAVGELAPEERRHVMAHVVGCAACARTWRVVREIAREARAFDPEVPASAPDERTGGHTLPFRRVRRALFAGGAAALLAAAVLLLWMRGATKAPDDPGGGPGVVRGGTEEEVVLVAASATRLAWRPVHGAHHYRVEVFTHEGALVWSRDEVTTTSVEVAPALAPGEYRWHVEAWVRGVRIAVSLPARFAVVP
jgi:hypothetical protein